ncbi:hypothetical protein CLF_101823 [Clonorchis sinensis]|uniref:Uncharacterized protein n=1 Tax=Clonorchis sinensis TaxID=79923 RepID=G7Y6N0_CLOSI|nr:hypothetical protein CLF_101823 [Clonorchis sinensis]
MHTIFTAEDDYHNGLASAGYVVRTLTNSNTKYAATWTKVAKELSSLNEYLALSTPGPLAANKVIQPSNAAIKTAMASLVDRRLRERRLISWSSTPSKVASLLVDTVVIHDPDSQNHKPDYSESGSPSYTQLAKLSARVSDVHASTKGRRLQPNKPYTIRQIRKLLAGLKVQSSAKTSFMGAPPKELLTSEVAAQAFTEKFGTVSFSSFTAFENALNQYVKGNYVVLVRSSSNRSTNAVLRYGWVYYKSSKRPPRPTKSQGIRRI